MNWKNGWRKHGYCDRQNFVVNLGCYYSPQTLVNMLLHGQWGEGGISQLEGTFYTGMRESLTLSTYSISITGRNTYFKSEAFL